MEHGGGRPDDTFMSTGRCGRTRSSARALWRAALYALVVVATIGWAPAWGALGDLSLASTSDTGVKGNGERPSIAAAGTQVAFESQSRRLDPADLDTTNDVYVKNLATGDIVLASTSSAGVKGNGPSYAPSLSGDGTRVAFVSEARNLDPADTDAMPDVYVKDLVSGGVMLASSRAGGVKANADSAQPSLSADGASVAFTSSATNLDPADTDPLPDVYVKDLATGALTLASESGAGAKGDGASGEPSLSGDGSKVAFSSEASNLTPEDRDPILDVFVKDLNSGGLTLASVSAAGTKSDAFSNHPSLSADSGMVAFFTLASNLDPIDTDFVGDVYAKDLSSGSLILVSASDAGAKGDDESFDPAISGDGGRVSFTSFASNLDPADGDFISDVFVKDLATGDVEVVSTSAAGTKGNAGSFQPSPSSDGSRIAFWSLASNLIPSDPDFGPDVYVKEGAPSAPPAADLSVALSGAPDAVLHGATFTYTIVVTNDGPAPASGVEVSDPLPASVSFLSATPTQGTCVGGQVVTCVLGSLAAGDSSSVDVEVITTAAATVVNAASVSAVEPDPNPANNSDSATTEILPVADLSITGTDAPDPVLAGGTLVYTLRVRNAGPDDATGIEFTDVLSPEVAFVAGETGQGPGCTDSGGVVHCALGMLSPGSSADVVIEVRPLREGVVTNVAGVAALEFDPDPSNDVAEMDTTVLPAMDLSTTIGDSQDPVARNQTVTYTMLIGNGGPSAATGATLTVSFATDPKFESMTTNQGSCTVNSKLGTASCELGSVPAGGTVVVTLTLKAVGKANSLLWASASVSAQEPDLHGENDRDREETLIVGKLGPGRATP